jgi:hypothetical protein
VTWIQKQHQNDHRKQSDCMQLCSWMIACNCAVKLFAACNHHPKALTDRVRKARDKLRFELEDIRACIRYVPDEGANQRHRGQSS